VQPDEADFKEWLAGPVTEWVIACMRKAAARQQAEWLALAWGGNLDPLLLNEARVRADCYLAIPDCSFEDWKAIDDTED